MAAVNRSTEKVDAPTKPIEGSETAEDASSSHDYTDIERGSKDGGTAVASDASDTENKERDENIVDWDGPEDPANPQNFTVRQKWTNVGVVSAVSTVTPLASSMFAPAVPLVMAEFKVNSPILDTFVVSIYILGFALGPMVIAPLSELYGRLRIFHTCNIGFIIFTIACAVSTDLPMLHVFRFFQGCFGVAPLTIGGGVIADVMPAEKRGAALAIYSLGPLMGPVIGPVCGGFLAEAEGWRWTFWVIAIAVGILVIPSIFLMRESYASLLLEKKASKLRKETGNEQLRSKLDLGLSPRDLFKRSIVRPTKILFFSPIVALLSIDMAIVYSFMYLLFTTFTFVFEEQYGFSESITGLTYIGVGIGSLIGTLCLGKISDQLFKKLTAQNGGVKKPEYRLPPMIFMTPLIPIGFFIYGWTAQYHVQWVVPIFGTMLYGIGLISNFMCINAYLIDAFNAYAASAIAANTILRSICGGVFPLFGLQLYETLGLGWGNSLLAFLAVALCPLIWLLYKYGERIRTNPRFQFDL